MRENKNVIIYQISDYYLPHPDGAPLRHNQMAPGLWNLGIHVSVVTLQRGDEQSEELINGVTVYRVPQAPVKNHYLRSLLSNWSICRKLWADRRNFDLVHTLSTDALRTPSLLFAKLIGKPVIVEFTLIREQSPSFIGRCLDKYALVVHRWMNAYISISNPLMSSLVAKGLKASKFQIIPVGVFTDIFSPLPITERQQLRQSLGLKSETCYLIFVGSFIYRKGVDLLIDAFNQAVKDGADIQMVIIGCHEFSRDNKDYTFSNLWKSNIYQYGLSDRIHFTGWMNNEQVARWLQACDIFVFPSRREGLGRVILEAMSTGLPCICSNLDGIAYDLIEPEVEGIVLKDLQINELASQILRLTGDHLLCDRLGQNARIKALKCFQFDSCLAAYHDLFYSIIRSGT